MCRNQAINVIGHLLLHHNQTVGISAVYAAPNSIHHKLLWKDLLSFQHNSISDSTPWLLIGYFNSILSNVEKLGGRSIIDIPFSNFI